MCQRNKAELGSASQEHSGSEPGASIKSNAAHIFIISPESVAIRSGTFRESLDVGAETQEEGGGANMEKNP